MSLRDLVLSKWMIDLFGSDMELNVVARWLSDTFGSASLVAFKLAIVGLFTLIILALVRKHPAVANRLVIFGVILYAGLSTWWDIVLSVRAGALTL